MEALILMSPGYTKDFIIFPLASEHTITIVLLHKNQQGFKQPVSFFIKTLHDIEINIK